MTPLSAATSLDTYFLEARSKLLDVAAILDRIDRGAGAEGLGDDPRLAKLRRALSIIADGGDGRAERLQKIFSLDYDPSWKRPAPR
jgi:hypothetical protein